MKTSRGCVIVVAVLAMLIAACDRIERQPGGKSPASDSSSPNISTSGLSVVSNVVEVAPRVGKQGPDGQELYTKVCAACHQGNGQGVPGAFPPLDASAYVTGPNVERLAAIMLYGLMGPIKVNGTTYNGVMLPQGSVLKDEELAAVATYIRSTWSNKASGVEAAVFTKAREKYGARAQFNIQELGEEH